MNTNEENKISKFDALKWLLVVVLLVAGIVANSYFASYATPLRAIGWLVLMALTALIAYQTAGGKRTWGFLQDAHIELRKVVWPTRSETVQTTLVVIGMVAL